MGLWRRARGYLGRHVLPGPYFDTDDVRIGRHVRFGRNVVFNCRRVRIGDGCIFHDDILVESEDFEIGDYGTLLSGCYFPGPGQLRIGHNFWLGNNAVVDSKGNTYIGNNVGAGAHSQLWTHMVFGDVLYGCRFHSQRELRIDDDAWLVGHCLVSPVHIGARSLAMLGSLVTRDLAPDHCYAGVPAKDITDKVGPQFEPPPVEERARRLAERFAEFSRLHPELGHRETIQIESVPARLPPAGDDVTVFNVASRTYRKRGTPWEHRLMCFLLPDAKFVPQADS